MNRRRFVALVMVATGSASGSVHASEASCRIVVDAQGDARENPAVGGAPGSPLPSAPAADVLSADLASDTRVLTGVVRLDGMPQPDSNSLAGYVYEIRFTIADQRIAMYAETAVDGQDFGVGTISGPINPPTTVDGPAVTGAFDAGGRRVFIHAPWVILDQMAGKRLRPGAATDIQVYTYKSFGSRATGTFTELADIAYGRRDYVLGAKSCQTPGKSN